MGLMASKKNDKSSNVWHTPIILITKNIFVRAPQAKLEFWFAIDLENHSFLMRFINFDDFMLLFIGVSVIFIVRFSVDFISQLPDANSATL